MPIGSIIGGLISQGGANAAGAGASAAGGQALANATDVANRDVARLSPWQASGSAAAQQINALLGLGTLGSIGDKYNTYGTTPDATGQVQKNAAAQFQTDPGYEFQVQQGTNALDRSAAARGTVLSGGQAKALTNYGQQMGNTAYGNYFSRLQALSGQGLTAAGGQNSAYNQAILPGIQDNFSGQIQAGQDEMTGANALASGIKGGVNSLVSLGAYGGSGGKFGLPGFA